MINKRILKRLHGTLLIIISVVVTVISHNSFASATQVIAQTEDKVPGENGQFSTFAGATINTYNEVVFTARLFNTDEDDLDNSAIYRTFVPNTVNPIVVTLEEVVRENDFFIASGTSFHLSDLFISSSYLITNPPVRNSLAGGDLSNIALMLPLVANSGEFGDSIIAVESGDSFTLVAEAGATVESSNGEYKEFNVFNLVGLSANNDVTFFSVLESTENGSEDNTAYFRRYNNNSVDEIVRKGGVITALASMITNDYGEGVFEGTNDSDDSNSNTGLYKSSGSTYSIEVHEGDSAPSEDIENRYFSRFDRARINNEQEIGFIGTVRDENGFPVPNGTGLFLSSNNSIKSLLLGGQKTPDGTATIHKLLNNSAVSLNLSMNDLAQFALRLNVSGDLTIQQGQGDGIFKVSETEVIEIARKGDTYEDGYLRNFLNPVINNDGLVVFKADLQLEEFVETNEGDFFLLDDILIISDGIHYQTIERAGREYKGKIVRDIIFNNNPKGVANGLSDSGTVAYKVEYEDGTDGIHVWVPDFGWRLESDEGEWDDVTNWHFGGLPNQFTDVILDLEQDLELQGPTEATIIKSMSLGGNTGVVHLILKDSTLTLIEGMIINSLAILSGQGTLESSVQNNGQIEILENHSLLISGETTNNGALTLQSGSELSFLSLFRGNEAIQGTGTVTFNGEVQLGDEPALLIIEGNVSFGEQSIIQIKLEGLERGESYDAMDVGGAITLGGTLNVQLSETTTLQNGDVLELLQGNQMLGEFENIILPNLAAQGLQLSIDKTASKIVLSVKSQNTDETITEASSGGGAINVLFTIMLLMIIIVRVSCRQIHRAGYFRSNILS